MMDIEGLGDLIRADELKWVDLSGGNSIKVLRVSEETGSWTALHKAKAGTINPRHYHLGAGEFYMLSGSMEYRGGMAYPGDWLYEPNGAYHESTNHPEDSMYLAIVHGGIALVDDDDNILRINDWQMMKELQKQCQQ
ncbi:2,4'-dihydroxyacetophenone dioxygenase family protein [Halieaceae bacterium]|nr:2,4'-dihydroxyacetophenone dioxygenase family protein [Halieaceae bacterium]